MDGDVVIELRPVADDDIVTRLRAEGEWMPDGGGGKYWDENDVCQEAADEIERLRKLVGSLARSMMRFAFLMTKEEQETVMKAVRGE